MDKEPIREFCGVTKGVDKRTDEGVLRWFGHAERMENDRTAKRVYVGECDGRTRINAVKECLKEERFGCQANKNSVWRRFVRGNA